MNPILTIEEAAALLRCSTRTLQELAAGGGVPAAMIGGKYLFVAEQLLDWLQTKAAKEMTARQVDHAPAVERSRSGRKRSKVANWVANTPEPQQIGR